VWSESCEGDYNSFPWEIILIFVILSCWSHREIKTEYLDISSIKLLVLIETCFLLSHKRWKTPPLKFIMDEHLIWMKVIALQFHLTATRTLNDTRVHFDETYRSTHKRFLKLFHIDFDGAQSTVCWGKAPWGN